MKRIFIVLLSVSAVVSCRKSVDYSPAVADYLCMLDSVEVYNSRKEAGLERLKTAASTIPDNTREKYDAYMEIAAGYFKYTADSTIYYCELAQQVAEKLSDTGGQTGALILKADALTLTGYYMEAGDIMSLIPRNIVKDSQLSDYYNSYTNIYHGLYNNDRSKPYFYKKYNELYVVYRDSMLMVTDKSSDRYLREMQKICARNGDYEGASAWNDKRMELAQDDSLTLALVLYDKYTVSHFYQDFPLEQDFDVILESASLDLKVANQDVSSCLYVENYLFANGNFKEAKRVADYKTSTIFKMGGRTGYLSGFEQSIIVNRNYQSMLSSQRRQIHLAFLFISILLLSVIVALAINIRSKKLIGRLNEDLKRSNRVSINYVLAFFQLYSSYLERQLAFRAKINTGLRRGNTRHIIDLTNPSQDITNEELNNLYHNFDSAFLDIYPDFVERFNAMLQPDRQLLVRDGGGMNMELRIYALIKLGVSDSRKIAELLHCATRTVYNKRSEVSRSLAVPKDEFMKELSRI